MDNRVGKVSNETAPGPIDSVGELCVVQTNQECFPFACLRTKLSDILPDYGFVYSRYDATDATDAIITSRKTNIAHVYTASRDCFDTDGDVLTRKDGWVLMVPFRKNLAQTKWVAARIEGDEIFPMYDKFRIIKDASEIDGCSVHP